MQGLVNQLNRWRYRERLVRLAWGGARMLAILAIVLAFCCWVDFTYDRYADVPTWLRRGLFALQAAAAALLAWFFLLKPWKETPPIDELAFQAEKAIPEFDHRLVTAIQLNRPNARTEGMSPTLIAMLTREASALAARHRLTRLIDYSRLGWAALVIVPVAALWGLFFLYRPEVATALLKRQAFLNVEIPRSVKLVNQTRPLWPSGDEVTIRFEVTGRIRESAVGVVHVYPAGDLPRETYELRLHTLLGPHQAIYTATVPHSTTDFQFRARLADARTREMGQVRFAPRPSVTSVEAVALLPEYLGRVPSGPRAGQRYLQRQHEAEVLALAGSAIEVTAEFDKPVVKADLVLLEADPRTKVQREPRRFPMTLADPPTRARFTFDIDPAQFAYRIEVEDEHGFANAYPPQRGIAVIKDEPPEVMLLQENFKDPQDKGPIDDYEVNGMPVAPGGPIQVGYHARSPRGINRVWIYYRINDESERQRVKQTVSLLGVPFSFWTEVDVPRWHTQLLNPVTADLAVTGPFVEELGLFKNSGVFGQVELYKYPSPDPETQPGELEAGGRYNFLTGGLRKIGPDGQPTKLEPGDRVEFYVAVSDKAPGANRPLGRSESRIKAIVSPRELDDWNLERARSKERLRDILEKQRNIPFEVIQQ